MSQSFTLQGLGVVWGNARWREWRAQGIQDTRFPNLLSFIFTDYLLGRDNAIALPKVELAEEGDGPVHTESSRVEGLPKHAKINPGRWFDCDTVFCENLMTWAKWKSLCHQWHHWRRVYIDRDLPIVQEVPGQTISRAMSRRGTVWH